MNKMETKNDDRWRTLFTAMPEETLPTDFQAKVMDKIQAKAAFRKKMSRFWEICGVTSGIAVMLTTCVIVIINMDISFKLPEIQPLVWTFPTLNFDFFTSPSFRISLQIGVMALLLLIADSIFRTSKRKRG